MISNDLKMSSKDANENDQPNSKNVKRRIFLKGVDPDDNPAQGSILIEQPFSST